MTLYVFLTFWFGSTLKPRSVRQNPTSIVNQVLDLWTSKAPQQPIISSVIILPSYKLSSRLFFCQVCWPVGRLQSKPFSKETFTLALRQSSCLLNWMEAVSTGRWMLMATWSRSWEAGVLVQQSAQSLWGLSPERILQPVINILRVSAPFHIAWFICSFYYSPC